MEPKESRRKTRVVAKNTNNQMEFQKMKIVPSLTFDQLHA
jgi:hypothetical protein